MSIFIVCDPLSLRNGQISYSQPVLVNGKYPVGTTASFSCGSGYKLRGPNSRICEAPRTWTQGTPECEQGKKFLFLSNK